MEIPYILVAGLLGVLCVLVLLAVVLLAVVLRRSAGSASAAAVANLEQATGHNFENVTRGLAGTDAGVGRIDGLIREEFARNRDETQKTLRENREEQSTSIARFQEAFTKNFAEIRLVMDTQLKENREAMNRQLKENRETLEVRMKSLQDDNAAKLELMRQTVDEKLQETVEKRFTESFKIISDRLEQVHKGLGEMQQLATGVDDLKKVLSNVKTRGNMGEYQLGAILEQILSPEQYEHNAQVKARSQERVEYAVRLPGKDDNDNFLLLPIDSKFPLEDYERLLDAYEGLGSEPVETVARRLEMAILSFARSIRDKYINPPMTTDFAILFVPTEGLYAEVLRRPGLFERLQRECKVTVVGPTNLVAFLSSLQMGFRTLTIERRTSEVWHLLSGVKTEFGRFEVVLDRVKKKLDQASNEIDAAGRRTKAIGRKLKTIQELPANEATALLGEGEFEGDEAVPVEEDED